VASKGLDDAASSTRWLATEEKATPLHDPPLRNVSAERIHS
jgi:hypothetical protein